MCVIAFCLKRLFSKHDYVTQQGRRAEKSNGTPPMPVMSEGFDPRCARCNCILSSCSCRRICSQNNNSEKSLRDEGGGKKMRYKSQSRNNNSDVEGEQAVRVSSAANISVRSALYLFFTFVYSPLPLCVHPPCSNQQILEGNCCGAYASQSILLR